MKTLQFFLITISFATLQACSDQESSNQATNESRTTSTEPAAQGTSLSLDKISGKWLVNAATRDYVQTSTLKDAYFIFGPGNALRVNLDGSERVGTVRLVGDSLFQEVPDLKVTYTAKMKEDKILLEGLIQSMVFQFVLGRDTSAAQLPK